MQTGLNLVQIDTSGQSDDKLVATGYHTVALKKLLYDMAGSAP